MTTKNLCTMSALMGRCEGADGAVCWILVFVMWNLKAPDELLQSSPLTSWQVTQREQLHCTPAVTINTTNVLHATWAAFLALVCVSYRWEITNVLLYIPCFRSGFIELNWQAKRDPLTSKTNGFYWFDPLHGMPGSKWHCWTSVHS